MKYFVYPMLVAVLFFLYGLSNGKPSESQKKEMVTTEKTSTQSPFKKGEELFHARCAGCHGVEASGTLMGPTFLSKIYVPNHHGDASFHLAVRNGVRAHHHKFGNMPKIPNLNEAEVNEIIRYVRWLQEKEGIF